MTRSALLANPNLNYILPLYDGMTIYMNPAIKQTHRTVRMASFNATPVVMQTEVSKPSPLIADVGGPNQWYAVALADQVLRVLAGQKPVKSENVPLRLLHAGEHQVDQRQEGRVDLVRQGQPDRQLPQAVGHQVADSSSILRM